MAGRIRKFVFVSGVLEAGRSELAGKMVLLEQEFAEIGSQGRLRGLCGRVS